MCLVEAPAGKALAGIIMGAGVIRRPRPVATLPFTIFCYKVRSRIFRLGFFLGAIKFFRGDCPIFLLMFIKENQEG